MTDNKDHRGKDMTLRSLKAELRRLPEVEAPQGLKARLLAAIPAGGQDFSSEPQAKWHYRRWDFGVSAAAAVLILASLFMVNYGLSMPPQVLLTGFTDTSLGGTLWDQRLYDQNSCLEKSLPYELKWPVASQNEPGY
ncbi:MAG: hypothetical protein ACYS21_02765 [Planctomycetota bacterium]